MRALRNIVGLMAVTAGVALAPGCGSSAGDGTKPPPADGPESPLGVADAAAIDGPIAASDVAAPASDRAPTAPDTGAAPAPDANLPRPDVPAMVAADGPGPVRDQATGEAPTMPPAGAPAPGDYGTRATLPDENSEMAVAAVGTKIFVLGGYPSSPAATQRTLQIYDTVTNTWTRGMPAPMPVHHPVTAGVNGKLYSLGGQGPQSDTGMSYEYDPATNMWRDLRTMPTARGGGAAAVIDDKIYVVGGRPPAANAFEVYDISDNAWVELPPLPRTINNRNHLSSGAMLGKVYVAGGRYNGGGFNSPRTASLDMFDPATMMWTLKKPMLRPRGGMSAVVANGCFYVYGGEGQGIGEPNDVYPDNDVYNPVTDTWTALKKLAIPFHGVTGGAFVGGLIYMPGGGIQSGGSSGTTMHQIYNPPMRCE